MRLASAATVALLCAAMAVGTWTVGWWTVPMVAAGWGILSGTPSPWLAGLAGALAWGVLLAGAPWEALGRLTPRLGGIFHLAGWGMVVLTLGFAWLLGWSAARAGAGIRPAPGSREA
jgi:hypothetical protein